MTATPHFVFDAESRLLPCSCPDPACPICIAAVVGQANVNAAAELLYRARYTTRADVAPLVTTGEPVVSAVAGEP